MRSPLEQAQGDSHVMGRTGQLEPTSTAPVCHDLLSPGELMARVGLRRSRFSVLQKRGYFRHLEVKRPVGTRRCRCRPKPNARTAGNEVTIRAERYPRGRDRELLPPVPHLPRYAVERRIDLRNALGRVDAGDGDCAGYA